MCLYCLVRKLRAGQCAHALQSQITQVGLPVLQKLTQLVAGSDQQGGLTERRVQTNSWSVYMQTHMSTPKHPQLLHNTRIWTDSWVRPVTLMWGVKINRITVTAPMFTVTLTDLSWWMMREMASNRTAFFALECWTFLDLGGSWALLRTVSRHSVSRLLSAASSIPTKDRFRLDIIFILTVNLAFSHCRLIVSVCGNWWGELNICWAKEAQIFFSWVSASKHLEKCEWVLNRLLFCWMCEYCLPSHYL